MAFSDNSMIGAVLGTFFATLILTSIVVVALCYLFFIKLRRPKLDKQRFVENCQSVEQNESDTIFLCKSHSNKLSFNVASAGNKTSTFVTLQDHQTLTDQIQLKSIEILLDENSSKSEDIENFISTIGNFPIRLKLVNQNHKNLSNESQNDDNALANHREDQNEPKNDNNSANLSNNKFVTNDSQQTGTRKCHICVTNSLRQKCNNSSNNNDNNNITTYSNLPPSDQNSNNNNNQDNTSRKSVVRNHSSVKSNSPSNHKMVIVVDDTTLSKDIRRNSFSDEGIEHGEEGSSPSPTFEISEQWTDVDRERVMREKSTKGGVSYYVDIEANGSTDD